MKNSFKNLKEVPVVQNNDVCTNRVIGMNDVLEITFQIIHTGCIKPIISSMRRSVEFLTPHTDLSKFNFFFL